MAIFETEKLSRILLHDFHLQTTSLLLVYVEN